MDSDREILARLRDALEFRSAARDGRGRDGRLPMADVLADEIAGGLIPALRHTYLGMVAASVNWRQRAFQEALLDATKRDALLAGFPSSVWIAWGEFMLRLMDFMATPQESVGGLTAEDVLLGDYIPMTEDEWLAKSTPTVPAPEP